MKKAIDSIRTFNRFYTNLLGILDRHVYESELSLAVARVLFELNAAENPTARQVMHAVNIDEGYLSRIVEKFVRENVLKKVRSPLDGRVYHLSLTPKGKSLFNHIDNSSRKGVHNLIQHLNEKQVQELTSCMERIENLLTSNDPPKP